MHARLLATVLLLVPAQLMAAPDTDTVRFSNIRFATGGNWTVEQQYPELILRPANAVIAANARIVVVPAAPFTSSLEAARDAAWADALAGRSPQGEVGMTERRELPGDGIELEIGAAIAPAGGAYVAVVVSGSFVTRITFSADSDIAYGLGTVLLAPMLLSLEVVVDEAPPVTVTPGATSPGSPDEDFDWDGPDRVDFGVYDQGCLPIEDELRALVSAGKPFIGSVAPQAADWQFTLDKVRGLLADPVAKARYDSANEIASPERPDLYSTAAAASLMTGDPYGALVQLYAGVEKSPDDPELLFNFAASLGQVGLANESLAVLARLDSLGKKPALAAGVDADAALSYLKGYNEMLLGRLGPAKSHFSRSMGLDPFLNEAGHALALVQAHEGAGTQAKKTYLDSMWRFKPKQIVYCGASSDEARPPVDDMFDTSMGIPGNLVDIDYPRNADDLERFRRDVLALMQQINAISAPWGERAMQIGKTLDWGSDASPEIVQAQKYSLLLEGVDEEEPYILKLKAEEDAAFEAANEASGAAGAAMLRKMNAAVGAGSEIKCSDWRMWANTAISQATPAQRRLEATQRRTARDWYKITTALNARVGDPDWHEFNSLSLRMQLAGLSGSMLGAMQGNFDFLYDRQCVEDEEEDGAAGGPPADEDSPCSQLLGDLSFSHSMSVPGGPKFGFDIGCDKIKVDVEYDLLSGGGYGMGTALGGFASLEVGRRGDYSIFAGARGDASAPGLSGGVKSGLYLEGDAGGVTGMGGRVNISGSAGVGKLSRSGGDDMKFNVLPETPRPSRGPRLSAYR
jgi:tetratricopeptide (TPR) repeat protein